MTCHLKASHALTVLMCLLVRLNAEEIGLPSLREHVVPKAVAVMGTLRCGTKPAANVKVRLFRVDSNGKKTLAVLLGRSSL